MWSSDNGGAVSLENRGAAYCSHLAAAARPGWKHVEWRDSEIKSSRRGWQRTRCSGLTQSRKQSEAVRPQRRDSSSSYGCAAELGIGAAGWCGDQAMTGLLVWNQVRQRDAVIELRRRARSGSECGGVMRLSRCGCAVGVERSAAAVATELGKRRIHKVQACALNVLGMR